ncbi:formimidoylglutamase [Muriicola soli]|uniref:Formimidoylglutamase n=1 Tax=Muriicola soli TaxID=2507538 RepID=A0A411E6H3_9FLAO|nr:formimidoylglutamase [Muriicola soli]QBA63238.1 formimidoylglutamase [Muriicola soli]
MGKFYTKPDKSQWSGRISGKREYLHEKVLLKDLDKGDIFQYENRAYALLGYACDEGVKRNSGRPGAVKGPYAIRTELGKMANHLPEDVQLIDAGNVHCPEGDLESSQDLLANMTTKLIKQGATPLLLGGGHDIAYGHFRGIKSGMEKGNRLGIINFDAHFDLRSNERGNHSGSPFYQIANECSAEGEPFDYLCLGIRKEANPPELFETASRFGVKYVELPEFSISNVTAVKKTIVDFISRVDKVYVTIDMDGFSSAYSPGVSASSPVGFKPELVFSSLKTIIDSRKLVGLDVAETNPLYDQDQQTAKLAAGMIYYAIHNLALL